MNRRIDKCVDHEADQECTHTPYIADVAPELMEPPC